MTRAPRTLRAISYNILADQFSHHHTYCPAHALQWQNRLSRIMHQLVTLDTDLLFLQEVEGRVYPQLQTTLDVLGYDSLYCGTRPQSDSDFGPVLAYRRSRLGLCSPESKRTCTFSSGLLHWYAPAAGILDDEFHRQLGVCPEGAAMAMLYTRQGPRGPVVCAVSTHLHWDPKLPDVKAAQAAVLCSEIARFRDDMGISPKDVAVIVGGDFNSLPEKLHADVFDPVVPALGFQSGAYAVMTHGYGMTADNPDHPAARRGLTRTLGVCVIYDQNDTHWCIRPSHTVSFSQRWAGVGVCQQGGARSRAAGDQLYTDVSRLPGLCVCQW